METDTPTIDVEIAEPTVQIEINDAPEMLSDQTPETDNLSPNPTCTGLGGAACRGCLLAGGGCPAMAMFDKLAAYEKSAEPNESLLDQIADPLEKEPSPVETAMDNETDFAPRSYLDELFDDSISAVVADGLVAKTQPVFESRDDLTDTEVKSSTDSLVELKEETQNYPDNSSDINKIVESSDTPIQIKPETEPVNIFDQPPVKAITKETTAEQMLPAIEERAEPEMPTVAKPDLAESIIVETAEKPLSIVETEPGAVITELSRPENNLDVKADGDSGVETLFVPDDVVFINHRSSEVVEPPISDDCDSVAARAEANTQVAYDEEYLGIKDDIESLTISPMFNEIETRTVETIKPTPMSIVDEIETKTTETDELMPETIVDENDIEVESAELAAELTNDKVEQSTDATEKIAQTVGSDIGFTKVEVAQLDPDCSKYDRPAPADVDTITLDNKLPAQDAVTDFDQPPNISSPTLASSFIIIIQRHLAIRALKSY